MLPWALQTRRARYKCFLPHGFELGALRDYAWKRGISSSDITVPTSLCNMISRLIHKIRKSVALKGSARQPPEGSCIVYAENYESGVE